MTLTIKYCKNEKKPPRTAKVVDNNKCKHVSESMYDINHTNEDEHLHIEEVHVSKNALH